MTPTTLAFLIVALLAVIRVYKRGEIANPGAFATSWITAASVLMIELLWAFVRAINFGSSNALVHVENWSNGTGYALVGFASYWLIKALVPKDDDPETPPTNPTN